jgi:acyl-CoA thioesterase FadM
MHQLTSPIVFTIRTRYVECDSLGEVFLHSWLMYFGEATATALRSRGLDLRQLCGPGGPLVQSGGSVQVRERVGVDRQVDFRLAAGEASDPAGFDVCLQAAAANSPQILAEGVLNFRWRTSCSALAQQAEWKALFANARE